MPTKHKLMIAVSVILLVAVLVIISATTKAQTSQPYTQVIMNLLNGQQYFGVPHVYQGNSPTNQWPVYYGPSTASQYWSQGGISSDQPVLELAPSPWSGGAMFWSETYSGGPVKITIIGTYSNDWPPVAHGYEIYLFLKPTTWGVSPKYNYSIPYISVPLFPPQFPEYYPSPVEGTIILPQSSTPYIVVQWDPWWQIGCTPWTGCPGTTGQWDVFIVNNTNGTNANNLSISPSPSPELGYGAGWNGIGTGAFEPHPGDRINITVIYNPSTNILTGIAYDMNTGQWASFTLNLTGYYTPPNSGNYVFGVGAGTSWAYADWALLYVAMTYAVPITPPAPTPPPPSPLYIRVVAPSFASWTIYANASTGWYTYYSGSGSGQFGPAFPIKTNKPPINSTTTNPTHQTA